MREHTWVPNAPGRDKRENTWVPNAPERDKRENTWVRNAPERDKRRTTNYADMSCLSALGRVWRFFPERAPAQGSLLVL